MNIKIYFLALICFLCCGLAYSQPNAKKLKSDGDRYMANNKYYEALSTYLKYNRLKPDDIDVKMKLGICHYETNELLQAKRYIQLVIENGKKIDPKAYFYLAKIFHHEYKFKEAISFYKLYLANVKSNDDKREGVKDAIRRCAVGMKMAYQEQLAVVEDLGEKVNSRWDDFNPVLSPNYQSKLYFSSNRRGSLGGLRNEEGIKDDVFGKYRTDMYSTRVVNGEWTATTPMSNLLNSPYHDIILDFNSNGQVMYFFKSTNLYSGEIFIDTFRQNVEERSLFPPKLNSPIVSENGDGDIHFFHDTIIIFSSNRAGGFGGKDLYVTKNRGDKWTEPMNLGPKVNSAYDETSPFLAKDGRSLYFSSNNRKSMGGLDVFKSKYDDNTEDWSIPENLGRPINSAGDDVHFKLANDGLRAFFSSDRKEGVGQKDLYIAFFKGYVEEQRTVSNPVAFTEVPSINNEREQPIYSIGNADFAPKPKPADVIPTYTDEEIVSYKLAPLFYENDEDLLNPNNIKQLNKVISLLTKFPRLKLELVCSTNKTGPSNFDLYFSIKRAEKIADYLIANDVNSSNIILKGTGSNYPIAMSDLNGGPNLVGQQLNRRIDIEVHNLVGEPVKIEYDEPVVSPGMMDSSGKYYKGSIKGLSYKVQIASIKQMYHSDILSLYNNTMIETNPNSSYYQYTIGLYQTFSSAHQLKKDLIKRGITDAFVVPYINGIRTSKEESKMYASAFPDLLNFIRTTESGQ